MTCSPARLAANRANAAKSTGPKTVEGKERSRANGLKHGLTGAGVVVPGKDVREVEARSAAFEAELGAKGEVGRFLARRAAMLSVRLERCARHEAAMTGKRVRDAEGDWDEACRVEVETLGARVAEEPAVVVRRLRAMPEGLDWLIGAWRAVRSDLGRPRHVIWGDDHLRRVAQLMGRRPGRDPWSPVDALCRAVWGEFSELAADQGAGLEPAERRVWAREEVARLIDAEVAALEASRPALDESGIAADRAEAGRRALFDPSREATLARKYEAAAEREMYRALRELRARAAEGPGPAPAPEEALGSSLPDEPAPGEGSEPSDRRPPRSGPDRPEAPTIIRIQPASGQSPERAAGDGRRGSESGPPAGWVDNPGPVGER